MNSGVISAVVALVGLLLTMVALFASWRVSRNSVTTGVYRDTASAWEAKASQQEEEIRDLRGKLADRERTIGDMAGRVSVLQDAVTGARSWDTLERRTAEMLALAAETRADTHRTADIVERAAAEITRMVQGSKDSP